MAAKKTAAKKSKTVVKDAPGLSKCRECGKVEVKTRRHQFCAPCAELRKLENFKRAYAKRAGKKPAQVQRRLLGKGGVLSRWAQLNHDAAKALAKKQDHTRALELLKAA